MHFVLSDEEIAEQSPAAHEAGSLQSSHAEAFELVQSGSCAPQPQSHAFPLPKASGAHSHAETPQRQLCVRSMP